MLNIIIDPFSEMPEWVVGLGTPFLRTLVDESLTAWVTDSLESNDVIAREELSSRLSQHWPDVDSIKLDAAIETMIVVIVGYLNKLNHNKKVDPNLHLHVIEWRGVCPLLRINVILPIP